MFDFNPVGCVYIELNGLVLPAPDTCNVSDEEIEIWYSNKSLQTILKNTKVIDSLLLNFVSETNRVHNLVYRAVQFKVTDKGLIVYPSKYDDA